MRLFSLSDTSSWWKSEKDEKTEKIHSMARSTQALGKERKRKKLLQTYVNIFMSRVMDPK
jgi:aromatic ring hydroxylase